MKYSSSASGRLARSLSIMFAASLLPGLMSSSAARAQPTEPAPAPSAAAQPSAAKAAEREAWRAAIARTPTPKKGCFTALYPNTEWQETPCSQPSRYPNRARGHGPALPDSLVGNGNDFSAQPSVVSGLPSPGNFAQASGGISKAVGSFDSVTPATITESGPWFGKNCPPPPPSCNHPPPCPEPDTAQTPNTCPPVPTPNAFSLQLNSQPFSTPACQGAEGCQGWQQFVFSQNQCGSPESPAPCVFIEYWLLNFGPSCPTTPPPMNCQPQPQWTSVEANGENDCFINSCSSPAPGLPADQLQGATLTGTAGDMDTVVLTTAAGPAMAIAADSVLNLAQGWNTVEWNVFGDCCLSQANFSAGSTLVVRTTVNSGGVTPPNCVREGFTGESNNLFLGGAPALAPASTLPATVFTTSTAIVFTETNAADRKPASCTGIVTNGVRP